LRSIGATPIAPILRTSPILRENRTGRGRLAWRRRRCVTAVTAVTAVLPGSGRCSARPGWSAAIGSGGSRAEPAPAPPGQGGRPTGLRRGVSASWTATSVWTRQLSTVVPVPLSGRAARPSGWQRRKHWPQASQANRGFDGHGRAGLPRPRSTAPGAHAPHLGHGRAGLVAHGPRSIGPGAHAPHLGHGRAGLVAHGPRSIRPEAHAPHMGRAIPGETTPDTPQTHPDRKRPRGCPDHHGRTFHINHSIAGKSTKRPLWHDGTAAALPRGVPALGAGGRIPVLSVPPGLVPCPGNVLPRL
jgi:hypothetical protein